MNLLAVCRSALSCALLTLCTALPAGAVPLDAGLTAERGAWATQGSGIARMVFEALEVRPAPAPISGSEAGLLVADVALDRVPTTQGADPFAAPAAMAPAPGRSQLASRAGQRVPSADHLRAPGTSSIAMAETARVSAWNLIPDDGVRFLQIALGMMALGFIPATLRRA